MVGFGLAEVSLTHELKVAHATKFSARLVPKGWVGLESAPASIIRLLRADESRLVVPRGASLHAKCYFQRQPFFCLPI